VPSFTIEAADLATEGAIVDVTLGLQGVVQAALAQATPPQPVPAPVSASLQVDTGASHSMVREGVLDPLGLHPVGTIGINTPTHQGVPCGLYAVRLTLPYGGYLDTSIIQSPPGGFGGQNIDGVIGRDVLSYAILIYMGQRGQFTLSF
jgi:hypothetical protein